MSKVGSVALLHHGGLPRPQDGPDNGIAATLATVKFWDPESVRQAYQKLTQLPFLEDIWDRLVHQGHKSDNLKAVVTLAFHKCAMQQGKDPVHVPGDHHLALVTLAQNLSPMGQAALRQSLPPNAGPHAGTDAFSQYLALPDRHYLAGLLHLAQGDAHDAGSPQCAKVNDMAAKALAAAAQGYGEGATLPYWAELAAATWRRSAHAEMAAGLAHWHGDRAAPAVTAYMSALHTLRGWALTEAAEPARTALNAIAAELEARGETGALFDTLATRGAPGEAFEALASLYAQADRRSLAKLAQRYAGQAFSREGQHDAARRAYAKAGRLELAAAVWERVANTTRHPADAVKAYRKAAKLFNEAGQLKDAERVAALAVVVEAKARPPVPDARRAAFQTPTPD
ncbi:tetratricopeptide repeat protein [Pandoraea sputorum]|uniref:Tetratricopeptide repeat protein n=1 Tax=Pandoraea sputorum TaxID=93222 RepID=A0A5E5BK68_9BURK|nr:hypothetical protein [Pandoraea sputorum]VVE85656.1 hypothetical protein PSP31121_05343 [Pandoraea sputorum]